MDGSCRPLHGLPDPGKPRRRQAPRAALVVGCVVAVVAMVPAAGAVSAFTLEPNCQSQGLCSAPNIEQQLDSVPEDIFFNIQRLNLASNLIANFSRADFAQFRDLEEM